MAGGINKVILIGNLGADPELKHVPSGDAVCDLRLATNESWTDKAGQKQESTEWHRIVVWGKMAENCAKYLSKGRQIYVEGKLATRSWDDKEGNKRYTTEIKARDIQFLGGDPNSKSTASDGSPGSRGGGGHPDDDIPF